MTRGVGDVGHPCRMETCGTEEPYEGKPHVRICGGAGRGTAGSTRTADALQRPLRFSFRQQLTASVDMIDIANGCAKRTYKSDLWRNRGVNHRYFLICTQGKS
jgi:hypothetical protein